MIWAQCIVQRFREAISPRFPGFKVLGVLGALVVCSWGSSVVASQSYADEADPALEATACSAQIGSCDYYQCRERIQNCGPTGYLVNFGYRYCDEFLEDVSSRVSPQGQSWMKVVAVCLQQKLDQVPLSTSCDVTASDAIASHPECYMQTGFCELPFSDRMAVAETIWQSLSDPRIDRVLFEILGDCTNAGYPLL